MTKNSQSQAHQLTLKSKPAHDPVNMLAGEWRLEEIKGQSSQEGRAEFEWLEEGAFLLQHSDFKPTELPLAATMIIGSDDSTEGYGVFYYDSRGVRRQIQMRMKDGVWKIWRNAPGFLQRFSSTFSQDGNTIFGRWEKSFYGTKWEHDFDMTYTKVNRQK